MIYRIKKTHQHPLRHEGFALIATISVMSLLILVSLALISLSTITIREDSNVAGQEEAQANARLALMMAIGVLQQTAGADTRITASAEIIDGADGLRQLTGVWRSWEGADRDTTNGFPIAPPYGNKQINGTSNDPNDDGRFLRWLISDDLSNRDISSPPSLLAAGDKVPLVSSGSLGDGSETLEVHITPTKVLDKGQYAWWVQGLNSKALIKASRPAPVNTDEQIAFLASNGTADTSSYGLDESSGLEKIASLGTLDIISEELSKNHFHDLTTYSRGLLTNASNGGWKRDLSLASENWSSLGHASGISLHTLQPGVDNLVTTPMTGSRNSALALGQLFYPWSRVGSASIEVNSGFFIPCATASWNNLIDFTQKYREMTSQFAGAPLLPVVTPRWDYEARDEVKVFPLAARIHYVVSMGVTAADGGLYTPCLVMDPVLTMWNPYNVAINIPESTVRISSYAPTPLSFEIDVDDANGTDNFAYKTNLKQLLTGTDFVFYNLTYGTASWKPGEVRVYSDVSTTPRVTTNVVLSEGYRTTGGFMLPLYKTANGGRSDGDRIKLSGTSTFTVTKITADAIARGGNIGSRHEFADPEAGFGYRFTTLLRGEEKDKYWGDELELSPPPQRVSLSSLDGDIQPFVTAVYGLRTSLDMLNNPDFHQTHALFEMNPLNAHYILSSSDTADPKAESYPYEWIFKTISDRADVNAPSGIPNDSEGYIGTSFRSNEGFSNLIINEIPTRPIQSLGELQHFNLLAPNLAPPFTLNPIGNSSASPSIASSEVSANASAPSNLSYDHSYISNQLLFDDWFVSSIAPKQTGYPTGTLDEDVVEIYKNHLLGEVPLPNSAYLPAKYYTQSEADNAAEIVSSSNAQTSWRGIASELVVDGMFNVNSTSVEAWKALFLHLKGADVPTYDGSGIVIDSDDETTVVTRALISSSNSSTSTLASADKLKSFARFADNEIENLAEYVVEEIKQRGPFLSLSEFLNRQLTSGDEALAGTLEAALIKLTNNNGSNHLADLNDNFGEFSNLNNTINGNDEFPEARDTRPKAYGFPGWVRQADLLRPLAPIISVRDDSFLIRAYGESSSGGNQAWCEAIVRRTADYIDPADDKNVLPSEGTLSSELNQLYGRKFRIVSFRWLSPSEI